MTDKKRVDELVEKAKMGNQMAFNELLNTYWKEVHGFLKKKSRDDEEAEDITIKAFAKAFDKIDSFDSNYPFKSWLYTISSNLLIDELRKKRTETISIDKQQQEVQHIVDEEPSPADILIQEQNLAQLKAYIHQLKPHYQQVINLRFFQEMSYKEMADHMNEPMNNIKVKLLRAKKLLAEIISNSDTKNE